MTLYSENRELKVKLDKALRALDEIQQWIDDELYNQAYNGATYETYEFVRSKVKDYRAKYEI